MNKFTKIYSERAKISKKEVSQNFKMQGGAAAAYSVIRKVKPPPQFGILAAELYKFGPVQSMILIVFLTLAASVFNGCGGDGNKNPPTQQPQTYTVSFNTNGGSAVAARSVQQGGTIDAAPATTRTGYDFVGWYADNNTFANSVIFPYTVMQNVALYAKWTAEAEEIKVIENDCGIDEVVAMGGTEQKSIVTFTAKSAWNASITVSNQVNNFSSMRVADTVVVENSNYGCTIFPESGPAGKNTIAITCNNNESTSDRVIEVNIFTGNDQLIIPVVQKPLSRPIFTTIDHPGAASTMLLRINDNGSILGNIDLGFMSIRSFLYDGGDFADIVVPGKEFLTGAEGFNNLRQIVGNIYEVKGWISPVGGFLKDGDSYSVIDGPYNAVSYMIQDINDSGQIVGHFDDSAGGTHGFLYDRTKNSFTVIDHPDAVSTYAYGINNSGQIVGQYSDSDGNDHGFLKSGSVYTTIDHPNARGGETFAGGTLITGINDSGQIVGAYMDSNYRATGFLKSGGRFIEFGHENAIHNAQGTRAYGINNSGRIVGFFGDSNSGGRIRGFVLDGLK